MPLFGWINAEGIAIFWRDGSAIRLNGNALTNFLSSGSSGLSLDEERHSNDRRQVPRFLPRRMSFTGFLPVSNISGFFPDTIHTPILM
jgi:hypothetical protein